jgi:hypothetical protein
LSGIESSQLFEHLSHVLYNGLNFIYRAIVLICDIYQKAFNCKFVFRIGNRFGSSSQARFLGFFNYFIELFTFSGSAFEQVS